MLGATLRLTSIKFGREWGYFYLLSAIETGISFGAIRIFRPCKRFLSHVGPSVARLPLLVSNIASAIIVIYLSFFCIVIFFTQIVFSLAGWCNRWMVTKYLNFNLFLTLSKSTGVSLLFGLFRCSFGETVRLLHPFHEPFTDHSGARILQQFTFDQNKTKIAQVSYEFYFLSIMIFCVIYFCFCQRRGHDTTTLVSWHFVRNIHNRLYNVRFDIP